MSFTIIGKKSAPLVSVRLFDGAWRKGVAVENVRQLVKTKSTESCCRSSFSTAARDTKSSEMSSTTKGKILVLGGTGFVGSEIIRQAVTKGYSVTSLSRRGNLGESTPLYNVEYRKGDALDEATVKDILSSAQEPYIACIHALGLLLDGQSGLGKYNRLASGSGTVPDDTTTYDDITRKSAFYAIEAAKDYVKQHGKESKFPFVFISAAEAGWPDKKGGPFIEKNLAPDWLRRYLAAKRTVEEKMLENDDAIRPVIFRPSPIYSFGRYSTLPAAFAFTLGNTIGLPFVDRPVSVEALSAAALHSIDDNTISGIQSYKEIGQMCGK